MKYNFLRDAQRLDNLFIEIPKTPIIKSTSDRFISFGSCFACNIQTVMKRYWDVFYFNRDICAHYNTSTMSALLTDLAQGRERSKQDLVRYDDDIGGVRAFEYFLKKRFVGEDDEKRAIAELNQLDRECCEHIKKCDHFIITIGTSLVVSVTESGRPIARGGGFRRDALEGRMMDVDEIEQELGIIIDAIANIRGGDLPNIIFTISPQRYHFDREMYKREDSPFVINCITKSILRVGLDKFLQNNRDKPLFYYPAYEIVLDELRLFETISTYDFLHIEQSLTPKYVVKRFLTAFASDSVLKQLELIDDCHMLLYDLDDFIQGTTLPKTDYFDKTIRDFVEKCKENVGNESMSLKLVEGLQEMLKLSQLDKEYPDIMNMTAELTRELLEGKRVAIWGTSGNYERKVVNRIRGVDFKLVGFIDNDEKKWGKTFHDHKIYPPSEMEKLGSNCIIIASVFKEEITRQIRFMNPSMQVVSLD